MLVFYSIIPQVSYLFSRLHSSPLQHITSALQSPTCNFLLLPSVPSALLPSYILDNQQNNKKNTPTKSAPTLVTMTSFFVSSALCSHKKDGSNDGKSFLKQKPLVPRCSLRLSCDRQPSVCVCVCVCVCEHLNGTALTQPLCSSVLMRCVCVCDGCKRVSHWLTLSYAWNNSYKR